jgi:hypothetical protein
MFAIFFKCLFRCFRLIFQVFHLSIFYVVNVVFGCFKSRLGVAHDMHVKRDGVQAVSARARNMGDTGAVGRHPGDEGPRK